MLKIDNDNYFDVAEALHCWLTLNHRGISSVEYYLLCKSEFKPGYFWSESQVETENYYYNEIDDSNFERLFNELETFLENKED